MRKSQEQEEPASPTARLMQTPAFNLCILSVFGYMTTIDAVLFRKCLEDTFMRHPRFSSILVTNDKKHGKYSWRRVKADSKNHVFVADLDPNMESPNEFIEDYISNLSKTPFDKTKPLWEAHILNVKTSHSNSTVIFKVHHSIGDGVSLISLGLASSKKTSDPESLPTMPFKKHKPIKATKNGLLRRLMFLFWTTFLILFYTLIDCILFVATFLFLKDTKTPIKGSSRGVIKLSPKRFVHRVVNLDDVKLVKNAMNVSFNDVILGVTTAGLSHYLNMRYEKERECEAKDVKKTNFLPKNLRFRTAVVFNLRPSPSVEDLAEVIEKEKELSGMWGNLVSIVLVPLTIALQDDPLAYINGAKATMDRKKLSLEPKISFILLKLLIKLFGIKIASAMTSKVISSTTLGFSNVAGPQEDIILFGHPLCYIAPTLSGFPQALVIHYQSCANKLAICLAADEKLIPNPHQLCDDLQKSLENIKETVIKRGLAED
ncbi:Long-chain-alcohol O-fatty-acyltransferase [Handroanthus impetiginosus]|uniref:Long-chain-alcohol O-fatty-acyltransferase n=1 Tax=Handroanthus impetiginosus TaxID=429701 RepID=A0A2G9IBK4_9LAMI|nr:Long-chain-alcohol O-fatty-acyltransferase [Handroanthus impetiginosus]